MNRQQLWDRMKRAGITHSKRPDCPPDPDLKVVLACCQISAKGIVDFLCGLDSPVDTNPKKPTFNQAGIIPEQGE